MKYSLGISNFLEKLSSFPFYCFPLFLCIDHWGRLFYLSLLFFGTLHSDAYICPFLLCFSFFSFSHLCKASSDSHFSFFAFLFPGDGLDHCLPYRVYTEYIMQNTGLDETWIGMKITGRNINNFRYANDTTLMAESEAEQRILFVKVKEDFERVDLKLNFQKTKIMASSPITSANRWEKIGNIGRFYFGGLQSH